VEFDAVLLDWRGTLVVTRTEQDWVAEALRRIGRDATGGAVDEVLEAIDRSGGQERLDGPGVYSDAGVHRATYLGVFADAGLDDELATSLYEVECDLGLNPFADDVAPVLRQLHDRSVRIGVVSDIHVDLRPVFADAGLAGLVNVFTLSFEQGYQKPDPRMFTRTLTALGVEPHQALMVGDRSRPDGAAVEAGLTTLLQPPLRAVTTAACTWLLPCAASSTARTYDPSPTGAATCWLDHSESVSEPDGPAADLPERFLDLVLSNEVNQVILKRGHQLGILDWWLTAGALFQTVWNTLTGRPPGEGIRDYDIFYFDPTDTSYEAEDAVVRRAAELFADTGTVVEIRNEARVHLWYEKKFGVPAAPFTSTRDAIDHFAATTCCHALTRDADGALHAYAPHGYADLFALRLRPNPVLAPRQLYEAKAARWVHQWPELHVEPWPDLVP